MLIWISVTIFDVIMRYFLRAPTIWAYELTGLLFGPFWLLGGAYVLKEKAHVSFDLFYRRLSFRGQAIMDLVTYTLFFYYCTLILTFGWDHFMLAFTKNQHTSSLWGPPLAPFWLAIPVGAGLILLAGVAKYLRDLYMAITGRPLDEH
jgi:TRAP-type mannitol/chloroaromatic compound transport system permease small subunit